MNKARLEWVMSELNQYQLTKNEDQFVKSALGDFDQHMLTGPSEETIPEGQAGVAKAFGRR